MSGRNGLGLNGTAKPTTARTKELCESGNGYCGVTLETRTVAVIIECGIIQDELFFWADGKVCVWIWCGNGHVFQMVVMRN